jgi:hypothetical protein
VRLEASTKSHVHQKFKIFWTNIASTMACPKSKNRPKKDLHPLGINSSQGPTPKLPLLFGCNGPIEVALSWLGTSPPNN